MLDWREHGILNFAILTKEILLWYSVSFPLERGAKKGFDDMKFCAWISYNDGQLPTIKHHKNKAGFFLHDEFYRGV